MRRGLGRGGFILLPVLTLLLLIALLSTMANRSGNLESRVASSQGATLQARFLAEAAMRHSKWFLSTNCSYRGNLNAIPFGVDHTYSSTLTDNRDGTIHLVSTGVLHGQNADEATHVTEILVDDYLCESPLYWTDWGRRSVRRVELDGTEISDLLTAPNGLITPKPLAIDQGQAKLYWGDANLIFRADVDGGFMEQVLDCGIGSCEVSGLDLDPATGLLYYADRLNNQIRRVTLRDTPPNSLTTNPQTLISSGLAQPGPLRLDNLHARLYFIDVGNKAIKRANSDGSGVTALTTNVLALALAVAPVAQQVYFFESEKKTIRRMDTNGGGLSTILTVTGKNAAVNGLDLSSSVLYWSRADNGSLQYAKADGTEPSSDLVVATAGNKPWGLALGPAQANNDPRRQGLCWTENWGANRQVVRRSDINNTTPYSTNRKTLVSAQVAAKQIKFDLSSERLFWGGNQQILRSKLNGAGLTLIHDCSSPPDLIHNCMSVFGLALDAAQQRLYFVDQTNKTIYRVNAGGGGEQALVTSLNKPWDIDLDLVHGTMYWSDEGAERIRRANLDGSSQTSILKASAGYPVKQVYALAVDAIHSTLYWFDGNTKGIYRSGLNGGSSTAVVSTGLSEVRALALDLNGNKLYWADKGKKWIKRANLDGSAIEMIIDLTPSSESMMPPWGLAVVPKP